MAQFHPAFTDAQIRLLGIIAIEAAGLDMLVSSTLAVLTGTPKSIDDNRLFARDTRDKANEIEARDDLPANLAKAVQAIPGILEDRNFAIHGVTVWDQKDLVAGKACDFGFRGKWKTNDHDVRRDEAWMQGLIDRIADVNGHLVAFLVSQDA